jgi:hypothetical protein
MSGQNSQAENLRGEVTNFGKQIDFSKDLTEGDINGYIAWRIAIWEDSRYRDRDLWIAFIDVKCILLEIIEVCDGLRPGLANSG